MDERRDGNIIKRDIEQEMRTAYIDYAKSVIVSRALPDVRDGLKSSIETAVDYAIDFGKSAVGIFTGNFENMTQVRTAVAEGGIIDTMSNIIDKIVYKTYQAGYINKSTATLIENGKDILLENISSNIKNELDEQTNSVEKLGRYVDNWKEYYNNRDFEGMTKEYNKIKNQLNNVVPLERILKETRQVEILHNLIKNNGQNFEITDLEKQLSENLSV